MPAGVPLPPVWLLGSSDYSARLAGRRGLGFAFAHHINPHGAEEAAQIYRANFTPSAHGAEPRFIVTASVICAETGARAEALAASLDLAWLRLRGGRPSLLPSPEEAAAYPYTSAERAQVKADRERLVLGDPAAVRAQLCRLAARTGASEVMATTMIHDHAERVRSFELLAQAFELAE